MSDNQPNQKEIIGYSFEDEDKKKDWIKLINFINDHLTQNDLHTKVIFHGTSTVRSEMISEEGLEPTDITHAIPQTSLNDFGSFWGDIHTASAYAEDTVAERDIDSEPVIILAIIEEFEELYALTPDLATVDFPLKGLTKLDDNEKLTEEWINNNRLKTWEDSLNDLGAIVVIHEDAIPPENFNIIKNKEDFMYILENENLNNTEFSQTL